MTVLQGNCPSCGAPINFKSGQSVVVICDYCHSAVARTDRALEDLGRVAEIVETGSPLDVGLRGSYRGVPFELTGRAQLGHAAGGMWDEWYAAFDNGHMGWLAEAQGRFYLTFQLPQTNVPPGPSFDKLLLGERLAIPSGGQFVVAEKGEARALGAKGEIPYKLTPGATYFYADLSGPGGTFGTLDYSEERPLVFTGHEVTLNDLSINASAHAPEREARRVTTAGLSCPNCGGSVELRAPDRTERVTCPRCSSLLDVNQGALQFLKKLNPGPFAPLIPIGATGDFGGMKLTIIGFMARSVEIEGTRYYWAEYLLYNPQIGFRWLVQSDNHWNFVLPIPPGEVTTFAGAVNFRGQHFKLFQYAPARVESVMGEFYWKVETGEMVSTEDYVSPPQMLSKEVSSAVVPLSGGRRTAQTGEINWSLGNYLKREEVEKAFNVTNLPRPSNVAPNQPFPYTGFYKLWGILLLALFFIAIVSTVTGMGKTVLTQTYQFPPLPNEDGTQVVFSEQPFELQARRNIVIRAQSPVDNSWFYMEGDLINDETGLVQTFSIPIEYYHGVEDGESWSEGDQEKTDSLSALPAGKYTLRLEAQWEKWQQPATVTVKIDQGVPVGFNFLLALVALSVIPIFIFIRKRMFETKRWSESMMTASSSSSGDDDDDDE
jgi:ribosomal protein S27AE